MLHLKDKYVKEVVPQMQEKFGYQNIMAVPKIEKVVVNTGFGRLLAGKTPKEKQAIYQPILDSLALITSQRPVLQGARKSIAGFKIRKGMPVGAKVTLRGQRMYDFLGRLIHIGLPRSRDFEGIDEKSFDRSGNLTIAIKEHTAFPEIAPEKEKHIWGFEVTVSTSAKTTEQGMELLRLLGFPIKS